MATQGKDGIAWTEETWSPVRGCSLVSAGCQHCYAMGQAHRFSGPGQPYEGLTKMTSHGPVWTGDVRLVPEILDQPLLWKKPRRVFVNSMSDLFHEDVPYKFIDRVFAVMALAPQHTFQVLTKRPERMRQYLTEIKDDDKDMHRWQHEAVILTGSPCAAGTVEDAGWPLPNVWLGISAEDQPTADERIPLLLQTPAAVRWVSAEPLLGAIDLAKWGGVHHHPDNDVSNPAVQGIVRAARRPKAEVIAEVKRVSKQMKELNMPKERRIVRKWLRENSVKYDTATELVEAANAAFMVPDEALDDETHWVWDEAADALKAMEDSLRVVPR